ncbi:MAG: flagellar basal body rod protein FlgB [Planctomycetes bacterium]|nr:flagellar basal body rod protein FlgB [Planctomycetota bacterium]
MEFSDNLDLLARMMTVATRRHEVVSANLANANTPNFTAKRLEFETAFREAYAREGKEAALAVDYELVESEATAKADGNNVDLEDEFAVMQKNRLLFDVYAQMLKHKLGHLKLAIGGLR